MLHLVEGITQTSASAVCAANIFHFTEHSSIVAKAFLKKNNVDVRLVSNANYESRFFDNSGRIIILDEEKLSSIKLSSGEKQIL